MSSITTTNPGTIRVFTQRAQLKRWQNSPRFKAMREEHARAPGIKCAHCKRTHGEQRYDRQGNPKLKNNGKPDLVIMTINHMSETLYLTEDLYLTWDPALMEPCCTICNGWDRQGKEVCPVCRVNPILKDDPVKMCIACYLDAHPAIKKEIEEKREKRTEDKRLYKKGVAQKRKEDKVNHPCKSHKIGGTCALVPITAKTDDKKCKFTPSKALKMCDKAVAKKKFIKILFPCDRRKSDQKCARKPGMICGYSASKAKTNCSYFKEREKKP
jgi:hypothetical protein